MLDARAFSFSGVIMELIRLSAQFYTQYANCKEILTKPSRPYVCITVTINGRLFAIPIRHHIKHKYCFRTGVESGLDYTKAVVITNPNFIIRGNVRIDQAEYNMIKGQDKKIEKGMTDYIKIYKKAMQYPNNQHYTSIRACSALQYFERYI